MFLGIICCCCCFHYVQTYLTSLLFIVLQKVIWIGPVKFSNSNQHTNGASKLAQMLDLLSQSNCDLTVVGNMACKVIMQESSSISEFNMLENASVVWEFLKGRKLPGVTALDRVCSINFFCQFCCCKKKLKRAFCWTRIIEWKKKKKSMIVTSACVTFTPHGWIYHLMGLTIKFLERSYPLHMVLTSIGYERGD